MSSKENSKEAGSQNMLQMQDKKENPDILGSDQTTGKKLDPPEIIVDKSYTYIVPKEDLLEVLPFCNDIILSTKKKE